jgi:hypothetical protein
MNQGVSKADHANPFFALIRRNEPLVSKNLRHVAVPVHYSPVFIGNDMIAHVQQGFNRQMQKALGAAIMFGIRQELIAVIALKLVESSQVLIRLDYPFVQNFRLDH